MEFRILGPIGVFENDAEIPLGKPQERAVLAALLLHANERMSRERLLDMVWGESPPRTAPASLYNHVSRLRKALRGRVQTRDGGYTLHLADGELDRDHFEILIAHARAALAEGHPDQASESLAEALALWRGDPLETVRYEPFANAEILRLQELRLSALEAQFEAQLELGCHDAAIPNLEALIAQHPWRERFRAQLMLALYRAGRQADALTVYQEARRTLSEELGIEPGAELQILERRILRQEPALALAEATEPTDLTAPATPLIGREKELAEVAQLLNRDDIRLLTVVGTGGAGKTRLALELARNFHRPVAFVELGVLSNPDGVLPAIAHALGVRHPGPLSLAQAAIQRARRTAPLVVLDCCERVLDAAPAIASLLAAAPELKVLATSRHRLGVQAEFVYDLAPLEPQAAIDLFAQRAQATSPQFRLTDANYSCADAICRQLDGLPLSIELAAARIGVLDLATLLVRLERRLPVLVDGPRDMPERQRTLEATIDWSYQLLSDQQRRRFASLAAFNSSFSLGAAEAVAGASLDDITAYVESSLLQRIERHDGVRFRMLDTIHEYADEKLRRNGQTNRIRRKHALHLLTLDRAMTQDRDDQADIQAAYHWAAAGPDDELLLELTNALWVQPRPRRDPGNVSIIHGALARNPRPSVHRSRALRNLARHKLESQQDAAQELTDAHELGLDATSGESLWIEILAVTQLGTHGERNAAVGRGAACLRRLENLRDGADRIDIAPFTNFPRWLTRSFGALALAFESAEAFEPAARAGHAALQLARKSEESVGLYRALVNAGCFAAFNADLERADHHLREALILARKNRRFPVASANPLALVELLRGNAVAAEAYLSEILTDQLRDEEESLAAEAFIILTAAASARSHFVRAARLAGCVRAFRLQTTKTVSKFELRRHEQDLTHLQRVLGDATFDRHFAEGASLHFEDAIAYARVRDLVD